MLALHLPAMLVLLAPICIIEYFVASRALNQPRLWVANGVFWANAATTLLGIPLTWLAMLGLELATIGPETQSHDSLPGLLTSLVLQAAWLDVPKPGLEWMVPASTLVLLVPYFFVSVYTERTVLSYLLNKSPRPTIDRVCRVANLTTYGVLAGFVATTFFMHGG